MKQKNLYFYTNLLAWGLVLLLIGNYVFGWTTPSTTPPGGNITLSSSPWTTSGSNIYYNTGSIGIGTTGPETPLEIYRTTAGDALLISSPVGTGYKNAIAWTDSKTSGVISARIANIDDGNYGAHLVFENRTGIGTATTEKMRITTAGNVGIGTTGPLSKLSVNGGLHVGGDSDAGDNNILADGIISAMTGATGGFRSTTYTAGQNLIWAFGNATGYGFSYKQGAPDDIRFHFGNYANPQFLIRADGNVIIAGTATATQFVGGGAGITGVTGTDSTKVAKTGDTMSGNLNFNNYGIGIQGIYSATRYQGVFAMSNSYNLLADGTTPGNLYGLAWTHSNVGGQSKAGLSHQLLVMENGITKVALGSGIWTSGTVTAPTFSGALSGNATSATTATNADKLDSYHGTSASTINTYALRDASGDISTRLFRSEYDSTNPTINYIMTQIDTVSNNYIRPSTVAQVKASLGVGIATSGNSNTVDGQHFAWSNSSNSPTYLWAANSNGSAFLAARGSISVNYANSAGYATSAGSAPKGTIVYGNYKEWPGEPAYHAYPCTTVCANNGYTCAFYLQNDGTVYDCSNNMAPTYNATCRCVKIQ